MTREKKYMMKLMEQTYRVSQHSRRLSHGHMVESAHILSIIAHYRELGDILEVVLKENGISTHIDDLQLPDPHAAAAAKGGGE